MTHRDPKCWQSLATAFSRTWHWRSSDGCCIYYSKCLCSQGWQHGRLKTNLTMDLQEKDAVTQDGHQPKAHTLESLASSMVTPYWVPGSANRPPNPELDLQFSLGDQTSHLWPTDCSSCVELPCLPGFFFTSAPPAPPPSEWLPQQDTCSYGNQISPIIISLLWGLTL
jgi:hypothetical protein